MFGFFFFFYFIDWIRPLHCVPMMVMISTGKHKYGVWLGKFDSADCQMWSAWRAESKTQGYEPTSTWTTLKKQLMNVFEVIIEIIKYTKQSPNDCSIKPPLGLHPLFNKWYLLMWMDIPFAFKSTDLVHYCDHNKNKTLFTSRCNASLHTRTVWDEEFKLLL